MSNIKTPNLNDYSNLNLRESLIDKTKGNSFLYMKAIERLNALPANKRELLYKKLNFQVVDKYIEIVNKVESEVLDPSRAKVMIDTLKALDNKINVELQALKANDKANGNELPESMAGRLTDAINRAQKMQITTKDVQINIDNTKIDKKADIIDVLPNS